MHFLQVIPLLVHRAASYPMRPPPRSVYTSDDPTDLLRTSQVRIAAVVCSGVSTVASLLALYWFCRMEKKFRHQSVRHSPSFFLTNLRAQLDCDTILWRIGVVSLVCCLYNTDNKTWATCHGLRLLPDERLLHTVWNRDMW